MLNLVLSIFFSFCTLCGVAQVINAGIGGNTAQDLLARIDKDVLAKDPDLVILMVGTNDMLNSKKMIPIKRYRQNLNLLIQKMQKAGCEVLLMSPPPVDSAYLFQRHDRALYEHPPNVKMELLAGCVEQVAVENEVHYLDLFHKFRKLNLPRHNEDLFFRNQLNSGVSDGVHPTSLGYNFIATAAYQCLKANGLLTENSKIICFGDSITNGAGSKGGGTTEGENYPSYLGLYKRSNKFKR